MKNVIISLVTMAMLLCASGVKAQEVEEKKQLEMNVNAGMAFHISEPGDNCFVSQVNVLYPAFRHWSFGVGTGLSGYEKLIIPVYGDARFSWLNECKVSLFVDGQLGHSFAPSKSAIGGLFFAESLGTKLNLTERYGVTLSVGHEFQQLKRRKTFEGKYFSTAYVEQLNHNSVFVKVGVCF